MDQYGENRLNYDLLKLAIQAKVEARKLCFTVWGLATGWAVGFFTVSIHYHPSRVQYYMADAAAFVAVLMMFCIWRIQKRLKHMVTAAICLLGMMDCEIGSNRWFHYQEQYSASRVALNYETTNEHETNG